MKDIVIPTLNPEDIEVKVKKVSKSGTTVLLYKTARTDMEYLDKIFGIGNWQCDYKEVKGNLYCTIALWDEDKNQWIQKVDCGIESREDGEGNEKKGEASDAFKRAGFKIGIGRELYSAPFTFISSKLCPVVEKNGKFYLEDPFVKFEVADIKYDNNRKICKLIIRNAETGVVVYRYDENSAPKADNTKKNTTPKTTASKQEAPKQDTPKQEPPKQEEPKQATPNATVEITDTIPKPNKEAYKIVCKEFNEKHGLDRNKFVALYSTAVQSGKIVPKNTLNNLTPDEWIMLIATMENLFAEGFFKDVA